MAFKKSDIEKIIEEIRSDLDQARLSNRSSQELNLILVNRLKPYFASISSKEDAHQLFKKLSVFLHSDKLERFFGSDILTYLDQEKSKDLPFKALLAVT